MLAERAGMSDHQLYERITRKRLRDPSQREEAPELAELRAEIRAMREEQRSRLEAEQSHAAQQTQAQAMEADVAKVVALMAVHDGHVLEYVWDHPQVRPIANELPYLIALPTTSGTGSEVGRSSVVSEDDTHLKRIVFSPKLLARVVFADPELTLALGALHAAGRVTLDEGHGYAATDAAAGLRSRHLRRRRGRGAPQTQTARGAAVRRDVRERPLGAGGRDAQACGLLQCRRWWWPERCVCGVPAGLSGGRPVVTVGNTPLPDGGI
jgi:hypothetical protein